MTRLFGPFATAHWMALLLGVAMVCSALFGVRAEKLGPGVKILDARGWYTPAEASSLFQTLDSRGRLGLYAWTEVSLDLVFPLAYGLLIGAVLLLATRDGGSAWVLWLPLAAASADIAENVTIALLAASYGGAPTPAAWVAAVLTAVKTLFLVASIGALVVCGGAGILRGPPAG